ncbi:MAG: polysaccharide biosynthesis protein [Clostridia bacterium]|nr:polysaccharide biosynthesis protein [Clostridia bacterium]
MPTHWWLFLLLTLVCTGVFLVVFGCYDSLWRYQESREYLMQFLALLCGHSVLYVIGLTVLMPLQMEYPQRLQVLVFLISLVSMWILRFLYRYLRQVHRQRRHLQVASVKVAIVGAGDAGVSLVDEIRRDPECPYQVVCFFDDDPVKQRAHVRGLPVYGPLDSIAEKTNGMDISEIIVAIPSLSDERTREVLEQCSYTSCRVRILPGIFSQIPSETGDLMSNVRDVEPEDLLGREAVIFNNKEVYDFLSDKVVMVTGGGGSIGSELCRQIAQHRPRRLVIVDIYENNAYDIQQELRQKYGSELDLCVEIASVRDVAKVDLLFRRYQPAIVFHAAAHKHVPLMEDAPEEAIKNNVFGTYNVADAAGRYGAEKFVLISTDKAVNPTNVMGASKRLCEMVVESMQHYADTAFVAVRFGNVLGSNGSVIPLFKRQLAGGGPLTVTDRRVVRYFMTIPEASQLVMQAGAMAERSQVFVLDMGEPVKILTLAENLVRMAGLIPYVDVDIIETGLRPGEKLYEELLMDSDKLTATKYEKIFVEQQGTISREEMARHLERLRQVLATESTAEIVRVMREIVPTFKTPEEVNSQVTQQAERIEQMAK